MADLSVVEKDIQAIMKAGGTDKDVENYLKGSNIVYKAGEVPKPSQGLKDKLLKGGVRVVGEIARRLPLVSEAIKATSGEMRPSRGLEAFGPPSQESAEKFVRGAIKGASLGYVDLPGEESMVSEFGGAFVPYTLAGPIGAPLRAIKGVGVAQTLARMAGSAAPMATVGAARPAKKPSERLKQAAFEGGIGAGFQAVPEVAGAIAPYIKKGAVALLSRTTGIPEADMLRAIRQTTKYIKRPLTKIREKIIIKSLKKQLLENVKKNPEQRAQVLAKIAELPDEQLAKAINNPNEYLQKPLSSQEEIKVMGEIKNALVKNVDDLFNFRIKSLEDEVAEKTINLMKQGGRQDTISSSQIKREVSAYINEMIDAGVIDKSPKAIERLFARIDRYAKRGISDVTGKLGKVIDFGDAHALKQDLYKTVGDSYGKGVFDDVVAGAYKRAARNINTNLRELSPDYAQANDQLKIIYDMYDDIGKTGTKIFKEGGIKKGASKWFRSMFNDPEGRQILGKVESILPENQRFMNKLINLEEAQVIKKSLSSAMKKENAYYLDFLKNTEEGKQILGAFESFVPRSQRTIPRLLELERSQRIAQSFQPLTRKGVGLPQIAGAGGIGYLASKHPIVGAGLGVAGSTTSPYLVGKGLQAGAGITRLMKNIPAEARYGVPIIQKMMKSGYSQ